MSGNGKGEYTRYFAQLFVAVAQTAYLTRVALRSRAVLLLLFERPPLRSQLAPLIRLSDALICFALLCATAVCVL